jgi:hypothetical protein
LLPGCFALGCVAQLPCVDSKKCNQRRTAHDKQTNPNSAVTVLSLEKMARLVCLFWARVFELSLQNSPKWTPSFQRHNSKIFESRSVGGTVQSRLNHVVHDSTPLTVLRLHLEFKRCRL